MIILVPLIRETQERNLKNFNNGDNGSEIDFDKDLTKGVNFDCE